jgi:hypothetical protein
MRKLLLLLAAAGAAAVAGGQSANSTHTLRLDASAPRPAAKLTDIAWLEGHWAGTGFEAKVEEIWTGLDGRSLLGLFRLVQDGQPRVYEIITVVEEEGSLVMRLKHFNGALKGWEEKEKFVSFPLVKLEPHAAFFDGLTYRLEAGGDTLRVWLVVGHKDGPLQEEEIIYHRLPAGG